MTITVTQLNNYIRGTLEIDAILNDLSVCGEITNVKRSSNGWYFTLKDADAAVNCFCFVKTGEPKQGTVAVAEGEMNYFPKSGNLSFFVRRLTATAGNGNAYQKFVELREKLRKEGLFDEVRKKPVPHSANKIGVVTSETGAVIHDIENVVLRRQPFTDIILYPVKVQGVGADVEIVQGIRYFDTSDVDVVIVGRGGGSDEDLSVFNSENVVRAIAACNKPIVSAVGHGIDFTLSDFAADKRAVTPSEAAEFVTLDATREKTRIIAHLDKISALAEARLYACRQRVQNSCMLVYHGAGRKLDRMCAEVKYCMQAISHAASAKLEHISADLDKVTGKLADLNPMNVLKRGYGYITSDGKTVRSTDDVDIGAEIQVRLSDGTVGAQVVHKEANR